MSTLRWLIREIHRRSLWQVLGIYLAASWVAIQVVENLTDSLKLPDWFPAVAVGLLITGLPIVLATAFVQEGVGHGSRSETNDPPVTPQPEARAVEAQARRGGVRGWLTWRNAVLGGMCAFALWGVVAAVWVVRGTLKPADAAAGGPTEPTLAVFPFNVTGGDNAAFLRSGLVDLLSRNLDGAIGARTRNPGDVLDFIEKNGTTTGVGAERGAQLARELRAQLFVVGSAQVVADRLRLHADLFDATGAQPVATSRVEGGASELFALADQLSADLLAQHRGGTFQRLTRAASQTTSSIAAFRAYIDAEQHVRQAHYDSATIAFQRAVEADSAFALAHYRLAAAQVRNNQAALAPEQLRRALAHTDRLSQREQELVYALAALVDGDVDNAERRYRAILQRFPDDTEANFQLALLYEYYNPVRGRSVHEAWEPYGAVLRADPRALCPI